MDDIPGNTRHIQDLQEQLKQGNLVAFVGAGASAGLYPLWGELIKLLEKEALSLGTVSEDECHQLLCSSDPDAQALWLKEKLGRGYYGATLRRLFGYRKGPDGKPFTRIHESLMKLPFWGYVTTNYDHALITAKIRLDPDCPTGWSTWDNNESIAEWQSGGIHAQDPRPVFLAHGSYDQSDTIVLTERDYLNVYKHGPPRRLLEKLWTAHSLVFVGFSFSDRWLTLIAKQALEESGLTGAQPRHFAIVGLKGAYHPDLRKRFESLGARTIFYRVVESGDSEDHGDLLKLLELLGGQREEPQLRAAPDEADGEDGPKEIWVHETTNDDIYVERSDSLERLDRWARDSQVGVVAVTGMGGLGKTSLIGHWLKDKKGWRQRSSRVLFYWSFYNNRSVDDLLRELTLALQGEESRGKQTWREVLGLGSKAEHSGLIALLEDREALVVLDGLEVLQDIPGSNGYGRFLDAGLREFLRGACEGTGKKDKKGRPERRHSLVVLTSRFPFVDLSRYLGNGLRELALDQLSAQEGAEVLRRTGVEGAAKALERVSSRFDGHPLALRIFGAALKKSVYGDVLQLCEQEFDCKGLDENSPLEHKLRSLLLFYERILPPSQSATLGILSLFRTPIGYDAILSVVRATKVAVEAFHGDLSLLRTELDQLTEDRLLIKDFCAGEELFSCHPVLRDHFRGVIVSRDPHAAGAATDTLLASQPSQDTATSISDIEPILAAVELLLDARDVTRAHDLYINRLEHGRVFARLPAFDEGLRCALGFVAPAVRARLESAWQIYYLNAVGVAALGSGDLSLARKYLQQALESSNLSVLEHSTIHRNLATLLSQLGRLVEAERFSTTAVTCAEKDNINSEFHLTSALSLRGWLRFKLGRVLEGSQDFRRAGLETYPHSARDVTHSPVVRFADAMMSIGLHQQVMNTARRNLELARTSARRADLARLLWIVARGSSPEERLPLLSEAEEIARSGHQLLDLVHILIEIARCSPPERALAMLDEPWALATNRDMSLAKAECLLVRAEVQIKNRRLEEADEDALTARGLSRSCSAIWTEVHALSLLLEICKLGWVPDRAREFENDLRRITPRLPTGNPVQG